MTNYEWLLNMGGEERQAWFDAQHEANDTLSAENDVSAESVNANDTCDALDSREKLEADASELTADYAASGDVCDALYGGIVGLLDRQAAITEREAQKRHELFCETCEHVTDEQLADFTAQLYELTAERDALADDLLTCNKEREEYRELFSKAITHAHEIVNLQP